MVRNATGAARVLVFDYNLRCRPRSKVGEKGIREPVNVAYHDYTVNSEPQRVRDLLPSKAEASLENRFTVINVWRPIRGPVEVNPFAACDAHIIEENDWVLNDLIYRDRRGEDYSIVYNRGYRWLYFLRMIAQEVMLLKRYDSRRDAAAFTAHTAFDDPSSPPGAASRESIEVRTFAFFTSPARTSAFQLLD